MINREFARWVREHHPNVRCLNREDDMGLPALRQAKLSYEPMEFARKFRIRQLWPEEGRGKEENRL